MSKELPKGKGIEFDSSRYEHRPSILEIRCTQKRVYNLIAKPTQEFLDECIRRAVPLEEEPIRRIVEDYQRARENAGLPHDDKYLISYRK